MSVLRQRFLEDLRVRNYSPKTQEIYLNRVIKFASYFGKSPADLGPKHVRAFQVHLVDEKNCSWAMLNQTVCALRFLYGTTLEREWAFTRIPYAKGEKKIPVVLSQGEASRLLKAADNMTHLSMILLGYSAGMRISEVARIECNDIDSDRMIIHIRRAKGRKDRIVPLSPVLLSVARQHWLQTRPKKFLFPGRNAGRSISDRAISEIVPSIAKAARIKKDVTMHTLRHNAGFRIMPSTVRPRSRMRP